MFRFVIKVSNKTKQVEYGLSAHDGDEVGQVVLVATDLGCVTIESANDRPDYDGKFYSAINLMRLVVDEMRQ